MIGNHHGTYRLIRVQLYSIASIELLNDAEEGMDRRYGMALGLLVQLFKMSGST